MILFDNSYFVLGKDFKVSDYLTVFNPTVQSILDMGEDMYDKLINRFISKPWDQKVWLFERGIDFEEIDDIVFFHAMLGGMSVEDSKVLFGDFDFSKLQLYGDEKKKDYVIGCVEYVIVLNDQTSESFKTTDRDKALEYISKNKNDIKNCFNNEIVIDKLSYHLISDFLRKMHHIPLSEKPKYGSQHAKEYMLKMEAEKLKYASTKNSTSDSQLINMISFLANAGNGYTYQNIPNMKISTFYDAVMRTSRIKHSTEFMTGLYAGREAIMCYGGKSLMESQDPNELNCLGNLEVLSDFEKMRKRRSVNGDGSDSTDSDSESKHSFGTKKYSNAKN